MITILLLIPVIGSILILLVPSTVQSLNGTLTSNNDKMKKIALTTSLINLFISLFNFF